MFSLPLLSASIVFILSSALAHPGENHAISSAELERRTSIHTERQLLARKCSSELAAYTARRKAKRSLKKRQEQEASTSSLFTTATMSASVPTISGIQNFTCLTAPEVVEGPYYINNEYIRQNVTEDQMGIPLELDIGVLDTVTCEPFAGVFIEIWSANATGHYGGFTLVNSGNGTAPQAPPNGTASSSPPTDTASSSSAPTGIATPPPGGSTNMTDGSTWLRGGWPTNADGVVGLHTIYPGYYEGRTAHVHVMAHWNWSAFDNGTIFSHSGTVQHVGQFFFEESWNDAVYNTSAYLPNTQDRTYNSEDDILVTQMGGGYDGYVNLEMIGDTLEEGLVGYITMGVNSSLTIGIESVNYYNATEF